ncbi:DoxX family protein [Candidatus Pseudothioglobus sp. Uisw_016]|jgi:putative oxidoreductase|uniref:DoxX family protein n=1 Tax=Candidatus Pseudothioglobus sp. Uisw_016 TaxID=3230995 RepID=UPI003A858DEA
MNKVNKYLIPLVKILLSLAFLSAGAFKIMGDAQMVGMYEMIGWGQWFRYVTGLIEVTAVVLIWLPNKQVFGAALLVCTMIGGFITHIALSMPGAFAPVILGVLAAYILYFYRDQLGDFAKS